jgi:hypothetical protein
MGPTKVVPFSSYGTLPPSADYADLYKNLGVSGYPSPYKGMNFDATSTRETPLPLQINNPLPISSPVPQAAPNNYTTPASTKPIVSGLPTAAAPSDTYYTYGEPASAVDNLNLGNNTTPDVVPTTTTPVTTTPATISTSIPLETTNPNGGLTTPVTPSAPGTQVKTPTRGSYRHDNPTHEPHKKHMAYYNPHRAKMASGGLAPTEELGIGVPTIEGRNDYRGGEYVQGPGDGQSDDIPAMLADGEYVIDAETVSQLGNGSNKAGAQILDKMRHAVRAHKRAAPINSIPPKAKSPLEYIKMGAKMKGTK